MDTQAYISSGIIETYAVGLATKEEAQILECIQKHNVEVRQAVIDAQKSMEKVVSHQAVTPPAHLKNNIWNAIKEDEAKNKATNKEEITEESVDYSIDLQPNNEIQLAPKNRFKTMAIAASIILLVGVGIVMYLFKEQSNLQQKVAQLEQKNTQLEQKNTEGKNNYAQLMQKWEISSDPEMKTVILAGVEKHPGTKALVYIDKSSRQTYLSVENLPESPLGKAYQLWAIVDGKPVDAGMYNPSKEAIQKMHIIEEAQAFAITLEKEGGSKVPTMDQLFVMGEV